MNRTHASLLSALTALMLATTAVLGTVAPRAHSAPGEVNAGPMRIVAAVDSSNWQNADATELGVPFSHAATVSGNFSVDLEAALVRAGEVVAGYLVGCAVDVSEGIGVAIAPEIGTGYNISPAIGTDTGIDLSGLELALEMDVPPEVAVGLGAFSELAQTFGVESALAGELAVGLAPGTVTALPVGAAVLDGFSTFPYTFSHTSMPLHVNGCLSQASAMPFITVRAHTAGSTIQTTGYGDSFNF